MYIYACYGIQFWGEVILWFIGAEWCPLIPQTSNTQGSSQPVGHAIEHIL